MRRTCKVAVVIALIAMLMGLTSCDGLFTTSVASGAARDPSAAAAAMAAMPTADLVAAAANVDTPAQAQSVIEALSAQAADPAAFLASIDDAQAATILDTAFTACVDMGGLAAELGPLMSAMENDSDDGSGSGDDDDMMSTVLSSVLGSFNSVDTTCVEVILNDSVTVDASGVPTINGDVDPAMYDSMEMGALAVAASALGENFDATALSDAFEDMADDDATVNAASLAAAILPNNVDQQESLATALNTLIALQSAGHSIGSFITSGLSD